MANSDFATVRVGRKPPIRGYAVIDSVTGEDIRRAKVAAIGGTHLKKNLRKARKMKPAGMRMQHDRDPAEVLFEKLGDISGIAVLNNYVLYAIYERPLVTQGGVHLTQSAASEDEYQGKAGLIVKTGPLVNVDALERGSELSPGTWVAVRPSDGWAIKVNGVLCRMINEKMIHMVVPSPDSVF